MSTSSSAPIIFYSPGACSLSCMVVAEWVGEPYELCRVERDVRSSDAFKRINPRAQVPALRIGDRTLVEASAILVHLAERRPGSNLLSPAGTAERDTLNQWLSYFGSGFHVSFYPFFMPGRYIKDPTLHGAVKDAAIDQIRAQLAHVDRQLSGCSYVLGEARSVLDPYLYAMSRWAVSLVDMPREYPNVAAHQERMQKDAAVQFVLATERGEAATPASGACRGHVML
jgi:glutathione S-transferase